MKKYPDLFVAFIGKKINNLAKESRDDKEYLQELKALAERYGIELQESGSELDPGLLINHAIRVTEGWLGEHKQEEERTSKINLHVDNEDTQIDILPFEAW